ncbi:hypothetical protein QQM39_26815 [Streptomyces sp. DT2A-34]|uniref:hypothetical protein n=1 Tax=Streptomyces sp. DT2A-34 TaxID=3051182 RepID=UPI00265C7916|nr:hypothetical protein [Streptomyces sp. DT2A-34]MDO0914310.1 hypothetical protein [Streptomyces sp. DT2A-34]
MLVEAGVVAALQAGSGDVVRIYAAGCVERMAQIFTGLRAGAPERGVDVDLFVDTLQRLWDLDDTLDDFPERVERLESFPEMQPAETGHIAVGDIYAFYSVLALRYATICVGSESVADAERCGHAVLTAMGELEQNVAGSNFYQEEYDWQRQSIPEVGRALDAGALRAGCAEISRHRFTAVLAR